MVEDGTFSYVQPAERDGAKVDGPDVVVDLFETDVFCTEQAASGRGLREVGYR